MPENTIIYIYGALAGMPVDGPAPGDLIFLNKKLKGWWLKNASFKKIPEQAKDIVAFILDGGEIFTPNIAKEITLEEVPQYLEDYKKFASQGKTIIKIKE